MACSFAEKAADDASPSICWRDGSFPSFIGKAQNAEVRTGAPYSFAASYSMETSITRSVGFNPNIPSADPATDDDETTLSVDGVAIFFRIKLSHAVISGETWQALTERLHTVADNIAVAPLTARSRSRWRRH